MCIYMYMYVQRECIHVHVCAGKDMIKCACTGVHMYTVQVCVMYSIPGYQLLLHIHLQVHVPTCICTDVHLRVRVCV